MFSGLNISVMGLTQESEDTSLGASSPWSLV
jgi:hypothetical protein